MNWLARTCICGAIFCSATTNAVVRPAAPSAGHVATDRASAPIDFNGMIDHGQDRSQILARRLRTKLKGKSLHLARGRVVHAHDRHQASVARAKRARVVKPGAGSVEVTLVPQSSH